MELGNLESMWYFGASAPRKAISRIQPALQFPSCFLTAMNGFPMVGANLEPHVWNEIFDKDVGGAQACSLREQPMTEEKSRQRQRPSSFTAATGVRNRSILWH
jgi:hypothetical protein